MSASQYGTAVLSSMDTLYNFNRFIVNKYQIYIVERSIIRTNSQISMNARYDGNPQCSTNNSTYTSMRVLRWQMSTIIIPTR